MFTISLAKILLKKTNLLSTLRLISTDSTTHQNSFVISYLINSCGVSQPKAISISKRLHFYSSANPDSVLTLLRNNGFSDSQISKITTCVPGILVSSVEKTLKPKFDFFNSKGLCGNDLVKVLCRDARVLSYSLEKTIIPSFYFLKTIVETDAGAIAILRRHTTIAIYRKNIASNIAFLQAHNVPDSNIAKLLGFQPRVFFKNPSRFSEIVEEVKKMKFDPSQYLFLVATHALSAMSRSSLEAKFDAYKSWGWSEDDVQRVFGTNPSCMMISEENIMSTMNALVKKFGYDPSYIAKRPSVLLCSCEKRIIPRCSVIKVLIKNGLLEKELSLHTYLVMTENNFFENYVGKFDKECPELLRTYQGKGEMN